MGILAGGLPMALAAFASFLPWRILSEGPIHVGSAPGQSGFQCGWGWISFFAAVIAFTCYMVGMLRNEKWLIVAAIAGNLVVIGTVIYGVWFATGEYYGSAPWGLFFGLSGGILGLIFMFFAFMIVTSR